jgi:hypothetical protein
VNPVISNLAGGDVVALARNNEVSGFNIFGGGTGAGIVGTGIADFDLNRLNISGATDGIRITNFAQTGQPEPFGSINRIQGVTITGSTMSGISLRQDDGGTGTVLVNSVLSEGNGADGLRLTARGGSAIDATVRDSSFNLNTESGIRVDARGAGSNIALAATNVTANNNVMDGLLFDIDSSGSFVANVSNSTFDRNGRNALRVVLAGGATGTLNATDIMATNSGQHGVFVSATNSTLNPSTFLRVNANNSGQLLMAGLRDAFNVDATASTATVSIIDSSGINSGGATQENGLQLIADMGSTLTATVTGSNFSSNVGNGIGIRVRDTGTTAILTVDNTLGNSNGVDGFFYDVTGGSFTAMVTNSSFNSNGRNAIRAVGGASPAVMNVTFDSTSANSSGADGVFFNIAGGGGPSTFNFTYLSTSPSEILGSGSGMFLNATFSGAGTTGLVKLNGIPTTGGSTFNNAGTTVIFMP